MIWLILLSPLVALTFLLVLERFEAWVLAAVPVRTSRSTGWSRTGSSEPATSGVQRVLVPRARTPQRS